MELLTEFELFGSLEQVLQQEGLPTWGVEGDMTAMITDDDKTENTVQYTPGVPYKVALVWHQLDLKSPKH